MPLLEKIAQEFEKSEFMEKAKKRLDELKTAAATPPAPPTPPRAPPKSSRAGVAERRGRRLVLGVRRPTAARLASAARSAAEITAANVW